MIRNSLFFERLRGHIVTKLSENCKHKLIVTVIYKTPSELYGTFESVNLSDTKYQVHKYTTAAQQRPKHFLAATTAAQQKQNIFSCNNCSTVKQNKHFSCNNSSTAATKTFFSCNNCSSAANHTQSVEHCAHNTQHLFQQQLHQLQQYFT